ncbi:MAG: hypothetical protein CMJ83_10290 [Planctomycetes bacterium]|nr:hypothetical protein [Planctomycetota bacterium]
MILDFCLAWDAELDRSLTIDALHRNLGIIEDHGPDMELTSSQVQAVLVSGLFEAVQGGERVIDGREVSRFDEIRSPNAAEYARLISKGRILYEHCMTEVSHMCVIGFMDHELKKSRSSERIVLDLVGWMLEQRLEFEALAADEGQEALRRCVHTDYIVDYGVSFLHGLDREGARYLAESKEPDD